MKESLSKRLNKGFAFNLILSLFLALIPIFRLASKNSDYFSQTLWAEDGLFTLCFKKASILRCTTDGFSGYLQLLPRLTGFFASRFDPQYWALVINLQAILIYFLITLFLFSYLSHKNLRFSNRLLIAAAPTLLAFSGTEIIGVIANDYLLLFYVALVYITFLDAEEEKSRFPLSSIVIFSTLALSSPFGAVAGLLLAFKLFAVRRLKERKFLLAFIAAANLIQIVVMIDQIGKREQRLNFPDFVRESALNFLKSFFYIIYSPKTNELQSGARYIIIWVLISISFVALLFINRWKLLLFTQIKNQILNLALLVFAFLAVLFISVFSNGAPHRYLNLLILLNILSLVTVFLNSNAFFYKRVAEILTLLVILNLILNFQVSEYRVSSPSWTNEWNKSIEMCKSKAVSVPITFTPLWPTINPHTYPMFEPLTNTVTCIDILSD
jgi:hypothetical protein